MKTIKKTVLRVLKEQLDPDEYEIKVFMSDTPVDDRLTIVKKSNRDALGFTATQIRLQRICDQWSVGKFIEFIKESVDILETEDYKTSKS
jgi:hypothetical protein